MRLLRKLGLLLGIIVVLLALPAAYIGVGCQGDMSLSAADEKPVLPEAVRARLAGMEGYKFPEEKSYLTFPEWYIVYSSQDYAAHIATERPSSFAYLTTATEFWTSYCRVNRVAAARYPFNFGTQVMIYVIGVSHSAEFIVKGLYENTVGRVLEWVAPEQPVEEEVFAQRFATDYSQSLNTVPWYDFDFWGRLQSLWSEVPLFGDGFLRKMERRVVLSAELLFKSGYGWMIRGGTNAAYAPAQLQISAVMQGHTEAISGADKRIKIDTVFADGTLLVTMPRYQPFTEIALKLAERPVSFVEIGGNSRMLVTLRVPPQWAGMPGQMFAVDVLAPGGGQRIGLDVPVVKLLETIKTAQASGAVVEHVYDY